MMVDYLGKPLIFFTRVEDYELEILISHIIRREQCYLFIKSY